MLREAWSLIGRLSALAGATLLGSALFGFDPAISAPYQAQFTLDCTSTICSVSLPVVAANRRLNVRWVSCQIASEPSASFFNGSFQVRKNTTSFLTFFLGSTIHSHGGIHTLSQEMDIVISATRRGFILLQVTDGEIGSAHCAVTGTLENVP